MVAADDTDILVLLIHHLHESMSEIYFVSQARKHGNAECKLIRIRAVQKAIGSSACRQIPTIHAIAGCDTTSAIFGFGKGTVFKKLTKYIHSEKLTEIQIDRDALRCIEMH